MFSPSRREQRTETPKSEKTPVSKMQGLLTRPVRFWQGIWKPRTSASRTSVPHSEWFIGLRRTEEEEEEEEEEGEEDKDKEGFWEVIAPTISSILNSAVTPKLRRLCPVFC